MNLRFSLSALLLRLAVGTIFIIHGQPKLAHPENFVAFFANHGIPGGSAMVIFVGVVELLGGILLVAGLLTRPAAFLLAIDMLVALFAVELREGFALGAQFVTMLLAGNLALLFMGSGNIAIDASIKQHRYLLSRFFVLALLIAVPFTLYAAGSGGGSAPFKSTPTQSESSETGPEHKSGKSLCSTRKLMKDRILCRLQLTQEELELERSWGSDPEECRALITNKYKICDGQCLVCAQRYGDLEPCWQQPVGEKRTQCARGVFLEKLLSNPRRWDNECMAACSPKAELGCCRTVKQKKGIKKELQDLLVKFWMYDFSEQAEKTMLSKKRIADFVISMEKAKRKYNKAKTLKQKEKLVRGVWKKWKKFARNAKLSSGTTFNGVLKNLRAANKK